MTSLTHRIGSLEPLVKTLADLIGALPIRRDLVEAALALRSPRRVSVSSGVGLLGVGIAVGATAALLWAPRSGRELRELLASTLERVAERAAKVGESPTGTDAPSFDV